jgi:alpha-amylase/alpha-mannosidase (GH57 family)
MKDCIVYVNSRQYVDKKGVMYEIIYGDMMALISWMDLQSLSAYNTVIDNTDCPILELPMSNREELP